MTDAPQPTPFDVATAAPCARRAGLTPPRRQVGAEQGRRDAYREVAKGSR
jgi:hypothetical protein